MEESKEGGLLKPSEDAVTFVETFDSNLTSLLTTFLEFNEIHCLMYLNK